MKHSIMIPDWVWDWWQESTGRPKPASAIREEIVKITLQYKLQEENALLESANNSLLPDPIQDDIVDFDVPDDAPTLITIERVGVCKYCLRVMRRGDEAFWFTSHGRKHLAHVGCWEKSQEESPHGT